MSSNPLNVVLKNTQLPGSPYSISWRATIGTVNEKREFYAIQVGYISPGTTVATVCVYNNDGPYSDGLLINPIYFYYPGQIIPIRGWRIAPSGYDFNGVAQTTTSNIPLLLLGGLE